MYRLQYAFTFTFALAYIQIGGVLGKKTLQVGKLKMSGWRVFKSIKILRVLKYNWLLYNIIQPKKNIWTDLPERMDINTPKKKITYAINI